MSNWNAKAKLQHAKREPIILQPIKFVWQRNNGAQFNDRILRFEFHGNGCWMRLKSGERSWEQSIIRILWRYLSNCGIWFGLPFEILVFRRIVHRTSFYANEESLNLSYWECTWLHFVNDVQNSRRPQQLLSSRFTPTWLSRRLSQNDVWQLYDIITICIMCINVIQLFVDRNTLLVKL